MRILIIGADYLGDIATKLNLLGITDFEHITGRKASSQRGTHISNAVQLILVLVDRLNHNAMRQVKLDAKSKSIPIVFANRSWASIQQKLSEFGLKAS